MQKSFSDLEYAAKKKLTSRDRLLAEIDLATPRGKLYKLIEPHYPKVTRHGRPLIGLALRWRQIDGRRELAAYLRCLAPGAKYTDMSLGRVLSTKAARGSGIGRELLEQGIAHAERQHPGHRIRIGAQRYLEKFYASFGFVTFSEPYDEDGIIHVDMLR